MPETIRFKYRAFLSYSHRDTRSTDMTGLQAELEAAFRKLPIAPPDDGRIPYEWLIPGIGRQLALMKPVDRKVASPDATKRRLVALKRRLRRHRGDVQDLAQAAGRPRGDPAALTTRACHINRLSKFDRPTSAAPPAKKVNHEMAPERFS